MNNYFALDKLRNCIKEYQFLRNHLYVVTQMIKNLTEMQETQVGSLSWDDLLEKGMATQFSILVRRIPLNEEPGGLQLMGSQRVGHD